MRLDSNCANINWLAAVAVEARVAEWNGAMLETTVTEFNDLPKFESDSVRAGSRNPTPMEIGGYPHFENACTNILQTITINKDTVLSPSGWQIKIFPREDDGWLKVKKALRRLRGKTGNSTKGTGSFGSRSLLIQMPTATFPR